VTRLPRFARWLLPACALLVLSSTPSFAARPPYQAASPELGVSTFLYDQPETTGRDLAKVQALGFGWIKALFRWTDIEHDYKGKFDFAESDRVVQAANAAGLKIIARLDFQPWWALPGVIRNGPPVNYQDYADFVYAFMSRYGEGSAIGRVHAVQVWNEPNLAREWGEQTITQQSAADYVRLLSLAYKAAKGADPSVTVITAGLSPTGVADGLAQPDDQYLQWMYGFGLRGGENYDVLGANANVQCPSVEAAIGACPVAADQMQHPSFYFRRVEQLREIMVANGDAKQQVWLMEFGWTTDKVNPSYAWYATDEATKAELIVGAFKYARANWSPWIGVMALWTIADPLWKADDEQVWWSITNPDGTTRPAFDRLLQARQNGEI
jgi:polysaccharide biosynthesis protein PslG